MAKTFAPTAGSRDNFNSLFERLSDCEAYLRLMYNELVHAEYDITFLTDRQQRQEVEIAELVDSGAKNRIIFDGVGTGASNVGTSYTSNGITFEVQSDGTVHVTGTISSGYSYCYLYAGTGRINIIDAFDGKHVLSGNPQGASESTYRLWYKVGSQTAVSVRDSSVILPEVTGETTAVLGLQVDAPQTNLDITFKPMICTKTAWDASPTYEPYALTNSELTAKLTADEEKLDKIYGVGEEIIGTSAVHKNLDDYKTAGTFFCRNSANAGYVDNIPIGGSGFRLIVENVTVVSTVRQTFLKPTDASHIWVRTFNNNAWGDWYVFEGAVVTRSAPALAKAEPEEIKEPEIGEAGEKGKEER